MIKVFSFSFPLNSLAEIFQFSNKFSNEFFKSITICHLGEGGKAEEKKEKFSSAHSAS